MTQSIGNINHSTNNPVYFPNLNGLRFIAAAGVMVHHIEQVRFNALMNNYWTSLPFIKTLGKMGVVLFFVLSGFLITYLLLQEEKWKGTIEIKKFYLRRMLRIWPLYFLILFLSFAILPNMDWFAIQKYSKEVLYSNLMAKLSFYLFLLPNMALVLYGNIPFLAQTWSIGTEEQFYLIWPIFLKKIKQHRLPAMMALIILYFIMRKGLSLAFVQELPFGHALYVFWSMFHIDCMAIGAMAAWILFHRKNWLTPLLHPIPFIITALIAGVCIFKQVYVPIIYFDVYAVLFAIIIVQLAAAESLKSLLENSLLHYLGKISYGLYMYHLMGVVATKQICLQMGIQNGMVFYASSFAFTILMAAISYHTLESYFLKKKQAVL